MYSDVFGRQVQAHEASMPGRLGKSSERPFDCSCKSRIVFCMNRFSIIERADMDLSKSIMDNGCQSL